MICPNLSCEVVEPILSSTATLAEAFMGSRFHLQLFRTRKSLCSPKGLPFMDGYHAWPNIKSMIYYLHFIVQSLHNTPFWSWVNPWICSPVIESHTIYAKCVVAQKILESHHENCKRCCIVRICLTILVTESLNWIIRQTLQISNGEVTPPVPRTIRGWVGAFVVPIGK